jgi:hypothetical protein
VASAGSDPSPPTIPCVPRLWLYCIVIAVICCLASMVIALIRLY